MSFRNVNSTRKLKHFHSIRNVTFSENFEKFIFVNGYQSSNISWNLCLRITTKKKTLRKLFSQTCGIFVKKISSSVLFQLVFHTSGVIHFSLSKTFSNHFERIWITSFSGETSTVYQKLTFQSEVEGQSCIIGI